MFLAIIKKDLKILLRDKTFVLIVVLMPIVIITILSVALNSAFDSDIKIDKFKIAIVKEYDDSEIDILNNKDFDIDLETIKEINPNEIFFSDFLEQDEIKEIMDYEIMTLDNAKEEMNDNKISAIIILDNDFYNDLIINFISPLRNEINIKLIKNPSRNLTPMIVEEILKGFNKKINQMIISKNILIDKMIESGEGINSEKIKNQMENFNFEYDKFSVNINSTTIEKRNNINAKSYYSAAMLAMFLLFVAGMSGSLLLDEKIQMTYDRQLISGVSKKIILLGKYFTIFTIAIVQCLVLILYSKLALNVEWGNYYNLLLFVLLFSVTVSSFGLMISIVSFKSENRKLATVLNSVIFQIMAALGGSFIPVEALPKIMKGLRFIPFNGVILKMVLNNMQGLSLTDNLFEIFLLILNSIVFIIISIYLMNKGGSENVKRTKIAIN